MKAPVVGAAGLLASSAMLLGAGAVAAAVEGSPTSAGVTGPPSSLARGLLPAGLLALDERAVSACPGLPWQVVAAIATVESDGGRSAAPGVHSGANAAGAEGPMQFLPATFAAYDRPVPAGGADPPSPYDPVDAAYATVRYLCASGAAGGRDLAGAVYAYDHDAGYVRTVLALARRLGWPGPGSGAEPRRGTLALDWALGQVGTPYVWGGEDPGVGFDCSGLVQAAYRAAGIALPRTAQAQFSAGPTLPPGSRLEPGDLVFFGPDAADVTHVGIYAGREAGVSVMVDAPHTGAVVRVEPFPSRVGAAWGDEVLVGATRPAAPGTVRAGGQ